MISSMEYYNSFGRSIMDNISVYYTDGSELPSQTLLLYSASLYSGESSDSFTVVRDSGKKPYFLSHPHIHFSVSHSGSIWAVAFAEDEVGLDIQFSSEKISQDRVAKRYFHTREYDEYCNGIDFYDIWTRKEAVCKLYGVGINKSFAKTDTYSGSFGSQRFFLKDILLNSDTIPHGAIAHGRDFVYNINKL